MKEYKNLIRVETETGSYLKYKPESLDEFVKMAKSCFLDSNHLKTNAEKYGFADDLKEIKKRLKDD